MNWDWDKLKQQQQDQQKKIDLPPEFEKFMKNLNNLKFPFGPIFILIIFAVFFAFSTFFTIQVDEVGIIQRFGKYVRTVEPGLNFKMPFGIEKITAVKIQRIYKEEFGLGFTGGAGRQSPTGKNTNDNIESVNSTLMLTGDLNVAVVPWIVQYRVSDPYKYLFKVDNINQLLRDMAEAAMSLVVGDRSINEVISKREAIADEARVILQKDLEEADAGINVITIEMKRTNVPEAVQPSFNEVNQAIQEKEKTIYQAREDYNKAIPAAKGEADKIIKAAEGYALERVNRAKGDVAKFASVYLEYAKAKDVTKRRMYLETLKDIFPKIGNKYIIDSDQKNFLPLLNLEKSIKSDKSEKEQK